MAEEMRKGEMAVEAQSANEIKGDMFPEACEEDSRAQEQHHGKPLDGYCVGVDLGSASSVVCSAQHINPRSVTVEVNRLANRATPSTIAYDGTLRIIGEEAESRLTSNPATCLQNLSCCLTAASSADFEALCSQMPFCPMPSVKDTPEGLSLVFAGDENNRLPVTLAIGHFLRCLVSFAEASHRAVGGVERKSPAKVAIAIPSSDKTHKVLEQLLLACSSVGLDESLLVISRPDALANCWCNRHIPDTVYSLLKSHNPNAMAVDTENATAKPQTIYVGLVDVGYSETSIQILELTVDDRVTPRIVGVTVTQSIGVSEAVNMVTESIADEIKCRYGQQIQNHSKKASRLYLACCRAVVHLSGLADSSIDIEGYLENDEDLHIALSRSAFEKMCMPLEERLRGCIASVLEASGLQPESVCVVDVVGGGSRIPWVANAIDVAFGATPAEIEAPEGNRSKLRHTLDGTSSAAMGAASMAAGAAYFKPLDISKAVKQLDCQRIAMLKEADCRIGAAEAAELLRLERRNDLESYLIEMKAATRGHHGKHLTPDIAKMLQETEHWLLDNPDATEIDYANELARANTELKTKCPGYFAAVEAEKQKQEADLEASAAAMASMNAKEDMDVKLPNSQCIKRAKKNKDEANELFKDGNVEHGVQRYIKALQYLAKVYDLSPAEKEEADTLKLSLHLNLAQGYLRLTGTDSKAPVYESFAKKALASCDSALELDSECVKALYRRALAKERLGNTESALADVKQALNFVPEDNDLLKLGERLETRRRKEKEQEKKMYAKMFN